MKSPSLQLPGLGDSRFDEKMVLILHRHWWALLREIIGVLLIFLAPFIAVPVIASLVAQAPNAANIGAVVGFLGASWLLICWHLLFTRWTDYYFDIWIITNWRIIDVDLQGLFKIDVATLLDLDHIQDITTQSDGIVANILNFGNIEIQTAGTKREFTFDDAPNPRSVERVIRSAQEDLMRIKSAREHAA